MTFDEEVAELEKRITDEVFKLLEATPPSFEEALKQIAGVVSVQLLEAERMAYQAEWPKLLTEPALMRRWGETDAELRDRAMRTIAPESLVVRIGNFVCEEPASGEYIEIPAPVPSMVFITGKLPDAAPALPVNTRTGTAPCGTQKARLVQCSKSKWHKAHPENEACPECDPEPIKPAAPAPEWYVHLDTGHLYDANYAGNKGIRRMWDRYLPLSALGRNTIEAKRVCGCAFPPYKCERRQDARGIPISVCDMPTIVKDPSWKIV